MQKNPFNIQVGDGQVSAEIHGCIYQQSPVNNNRRLVLLHGAGVAGELTWTYITNYLERWDEILVIDFPGMGASRWLSEIRWPSIQQYVDILEKLLIRLDWLDIDLCGYSFGGVVAATFADRIVGRDTLGNDTSVAVDSGFNCQYLALLEPAMLFSITSHDLLLRGDEYTQAAQSIVADPTNPQPFLHFINAVSPQRQSNDAMDKIAVRRLMQKPIGFAQAIYAVSQFISEFAQQLPHWAPAMPGQSFIGELSPQNLAKRHQRIVDESDGLAADWSLEIIKGADHSLIFTRPRMIAKKLNDNHRDLFS